MMKLFSLTVALVAITSSNMVSAANPVLGRIFRTQASVDQGPVILAPGSVAPYAGREVMLSPPGTVTVQPSFNQAVPATGPVVGGPPVVVMAGTAAPLYDCVKYKNLRNVAPCAVPMVVSVKAPCCDDPCGTTCVNVQICVPPCSTCPPQVCTSRCGNKVTYDFGKYSVDVTTKRGQVVVAYHD